MRRTLLGLCAASLLLAGCGNKGPLVLPPPKPAAPAHAAPAPAASTHPASAASAPDASRY
ncbi:LPS translocon maturation chaperone LptM [Frateuria defendens]|uniref:LPS translocon maturation chaperone LptM n=1 Tax=Frateuria defendens TaxID=2219559 RepID=UPI00066FC87A|nr:lipoprotein [Frateuria defendens]